ncbi:glutamate-cysteine ligase family protein [Glycomyces xiaoerkulensis]|uniref:glutamate-cysteine ligase family protein n=1 Tax=Glycomyces xiaoerkulensis TaxID=2038139 RepID=UPI000C26C015|nr:glutamate-cysteine ligase family protein [Glycomyces xiaoerkulensis]
MREIDRYRRYFAARFAQGFPHRVGTRTVGREAEFPVVDDRGRPVEVDLLWPEVAAPGDLSAVRKDGMVIGYAGDDYGYYREVGKGTVEVVTRPGSSLAEVAELHEAALARLDLAATARGHRILGLGMQPVAEPVPEFMTPKPHYRAFLEALGEPWLWFTLTSGDQLHVALSEGEVAAVAATANQMVPATVALCGNSPALGGEPVGAVCLRELGLLRTLRERERHGMTRSVAATIEDHVDGLMGTVYLVHSDPEGYRQIGRPFWDWLIADAPSLEDAFQHFLWHDHYNWHHCRPRTATGTIEMRAACQQPHSEHMAAAALALGVVEAHRELAGLLAEHFPAGVPADFYRSAVVGGLDLDDRYLKFIDRALDLCGRALESRATGEERYLEPLLRRLEDRANPGQEAVRLLEADGLRGLLDRRALPRPAAAERSD